MIVAAHQPNFLPWLGFFDKLARADAFVLLDDVQFPRTGAGFWTNRVRILIGPEARWITVPIVRAGQGLKAVNEVRIDETKPWRRKLARTFEVNYASAPRFAEAFSLVRELVKTEEQYLARFNEHNLRRLATTLGLDASKIVRSSELATKARGTDRLVELTRSLGGTVYLSGDGAGGYLDEAKFAAAGIELQRQRFRHPTYPQLSPRAVAGLSVVDALLNCGADGTRALVGRR